MAKTIADYTPDAHNANKGTARCQKMIVDSVQSNGAGRSIVVDKNGAIIGGNKTHEAIAETMGADAEVIEIKSNGEKLVVHRRLDLDLSDDDPNNPARRLAYQDNLTSQFSFEMDAERVMADIEGGFDFDAIGIGVGDLGDLLEADIDAILNGDDSSGGDDTEPKGSLSDRFVVPPFSVLDARQGYWQDRKGSWLALGIQSELGRGEDVSGNATPEGTLLPTATIKDGKITRGDGKGRRGG